MEASAKARIRCEECFYELVREIRKDPMSASRPTAQRQKKKGTKCVIL